ncbi:MAG: TfoX/Sxy family protein [Thermoplasmata archaeon]|nr:TfoX/Sxy family protein [Thermoplasmata archaeon]
MKFPAASPQTLARFERLVPARSGVTRKLVFGFPAAFAHGNMFFGVFGDVLFVRLSDGDRTLATKTAGMVPFEPMKGRPMREYVVLPSSVLDEPRVASVWVGRSLAWVSTLPPKAAKGASPRTQPSAGSSRSSAKPTPRRSR